MTSRSKRKKRSFGFIVKAVVAEKALKKAARSIKKRLVVDKDTALQPVRQSSRRTKKIAYVANGPRQCEWVLILNLRCMCVTSMVTINT